MKMLKVRVARLKVGVAVLNLQIVTSSTGLIMKGLDHPTQFPGLTQKQIMKRIGRNGWRPYETGS